MRSILEAVVEVLMENGMVSREEVLEKVKLLKEQTALGHQPLQWPQSAFSIGHRPGTSTPACRVAQSSPGPLYLTGISPASDISRVPPLTTGLEGVPSCGSYFFLLPPSSLFSITGSAQGSGELQIHFMNVGQGDGAILISPRGEAVLFDDGVKDNCTKPVN